MEKFYCGRFNNPENATTIRELLRSRGNVRTEEIFVKACKTVSIKKLHGKRWNFLLFANKDGGNNFIITRRELFGIVS